MDFFTRELGPSYVPAFAARLVLAMARGISRAAEDLKPVVLDEGAQGVWTLALVVVQWYAESLPPQEAQLVNSALREFAMAPLASNLNLFRERLLPFVQAAHQAQGEAQLAAAGVYFAAAVEQMGASTLSSVLKSGPVLDLKARLRSRMPVPPELKDECLRLLGLPPSAPAASPPQRSRAERFDRADFTPRPQQGHALPPLKTQARERKPRPAAPSTQTPPQPPVPQFADAEVTRAYLHTLGWQATEVDRLLDGPDGKRRV